MPSGIRFQSLAETNCIKLFKNTNRLIKGRMLEILWGIQTGALVTQSVSMMPCSWNTLETDLCITFMS